MDNNAMRFCDLRDVMKRVRLSKATIYRLIRAEQFPKPTKLGRRVSRWKNTEIENWIALQ
jgi:prophage regulatory protein